MAVQQRSTATLPTDTDPIRPAQAYDLHQRPALTSVLLVHTEEVTGSIPVSPTSSPLMSILVGLTSGTIPVAKWSAARHAPDRRPARCRPGPVRRDRARPSRRQQSQPPIRRPATAAVGSGRQVPGDRGGDLIGGGGAAAAAGQQNLG